MNESHRYDDIIDLPHPVSKRHPQMPMRERAAQFASFKALAGYEDEIEETGRLTDRRREPAEDQKEELDRRLRQLSANPDAEVAVTWFEPDAHKEGGAYRTTRGRVRRLDSFRRILVLEEISIPLQDIISICFIQDVQGGGDCAGDLL